MMNSKKIVLLLSIMSLIVFGHGCGKVKKEYYLSMGMDCLKAKEYANAISFFQKGAKLGDEKSQYNLGIMYYEGIGTKQDYKEAFKWHMESAKQGYHPAEYELLTRQ
jgi:TPR repeat protein